LRELFLAEDGLILIEKPNPAGSSYLSGRARCAHVC
jgi:hypothetical protein